MMKIVIAGIIAALAALGANFGMSSWRQAHPPGAAAETKKEVKIEQRKTPTMNVPIVKEGAVQGYVIAQFVYTVDADAVKTLSLPPEAYLIDEAFRALYSDDKLDFRKLEKYDLTNLTKQLLHRVQERMGNDVVKEVLVQEFNFVAKDDLHN